MSKKLLEAAAGNAGESLYAEDVFSTYLYDGTGSAQTITNGIDLSGEGGMVWLKRRNSTTGHNLFDTERGAGRGLASQLTTAESYSGSADGVTAFNSDGFGVNNTWFSQNTSGGTYASWTFRKAEKFFDVVTYTGNATASRTVSHNLGSVPGCIIVKGVSGVYGTSNWCVYHRSLGAGTNGRYGLQLNTTSAQLDDGQFGATATDTEFTLNQYGGTNGADTTYVAYLFASDAGGFGDDGSESIIKCGSYVGNGSTDGPEIALGFEPQWLLVKGASSGAAYSWALFDNMRGVTVGSGDVYLEANTSNAESSPSEQLEFNATGFKLKTTGAARNASGETYIYIAIRRPMKTPESGTEVFNTIERTGTGAAATVTGVGFPLDAVLGIAATVTSGDRLINDRMRGVGKQLLLNNTNAEAPAASGYDYTKLDSMDGFSVGLDQYGKVNYSGASIVNYCFKRATGFFDVVAYTGDGVAGRTVPHNLGVTPELMIVKRRNTTGSWYVYTESYGAAYYIRLDLNSSVATSSVFWNDTDPTSSLFTVGSNQNVNNANHTYIAYLFASVAGVSKVGSYTGTGADLNVDCGFSAGARFVLIKRTDSTGDWYVWDSARGIVAGNDPYLLLNSTVTGTTTTDYIDPLASGFTVTSTAPAALNASGGTYTYLAIA